MFLSLDPVAFQLGSLTVRWYGILIAVGMVLGAYLGRHLLLKRGINEDAYWTIILITIPIAIIGARAYYVLFQWDYYSVHTENIVKIWNGGLAIHGGIIAGILSVLVLTKIYKINFWSLADCMAPGIALGQAIGRWGNFFNQEAYGYVTNVPWAIEINGEMHHPTFLYESLWNFMNCIILVLIFKKIKRPGMGFLTYLVIYSLGRFVIESFRTDSLMIGPLRTAQLISIILAVCALIVIFIRKKTIKPENLLVK